MSDDRSLIRQLAQEASAKGRPLDWFEQLYARARADGIAVPWDDLAPDPNLIELFDKVKASIAGRRALVVGCGLGDDAEWLSSKDFAVTAFDIAPTAIDECRRRFPDSKVTYAVADLFNAPEGWAHAFDLVFESSTIQALPPEMHAKAIHHVSGFVAEGGSLLFVARARDEHEATAGLPWPLTRGEVNLFTEREGLRELSMEDYPDKHALPPVRRFRAWFQRAAK
ncbi:class I SAM-dependent methyltransferase [Candidatus Sumerlaeota bacterium]|nr:class I SAM-dependent methyltransferase [Candidatus Sumerlaeota bacterium]